MTEILRMGLDEPEGHTEYSIRLLQQFGSVDPYLTPNKIQELWMEYSQHETLFSDYTLGKVDPFLDVLLSPQAIIAEVFSMRTESPVGILMMTSIIPRYDAMAHFTFWDSRGKGREPLIWAMMWLWVQEFKLHRLSVEVPGHQSGVIRMIKRLGFTHEGIKREGNLHKGSWIDLELFGMTVDEIEAKITEVDHG